jgi:hypothetical protein
MNDYPRKPNPILHLFRWAWLLFGVYAIALGIGVLVGMLLAGWWWELPFVALFGFALFVLLRNRARRSAAR